eukprot:PhM_4_TR18271/c0_g1_i1/m.20141
MCIFFWVWGGVFSTNVCELLLHQGLPIARTEHVQTLLVRDAEEPGHGGVEADLLSVGQAAVLEQQLLRQRVGVVAALLHLVQPRRGLLGVGDAEHLELLLEVALEREVVDAHLRVGAHGAHVLVVGRPLHGRDGVRVVVLDVHEDRVGGLGALAHDLAEVPHTQRRVVAAGGHEVARHLHRVPRDHVHVGADEAALLLLLGLRRRRPAHLGRETIAQIEDLDNAVGATRHEDVRLRRRRLDIFNGVAHGDGRRRGVRHGHVLAHGEDALPVAADKKRGVVRRLRPVEREPFLGTSTEAVHEARVRRHGRHVGHRRHCVDADLVAGPHGDERRAAAHTDAVDGAGRGVERHQLVDARVPQPDLVLHIAVLVDAVVVGLLVDLVGFPLLLLLNVALGFVLVALVRAVHVVDAQQMELVVAVVCCLRAEGQPGGHWVRGGLRAWEEVEAERRPLERHAVQHSVRRGVVDHLTLALHTAGLIVTVGVEDARQRGVLLARVHKSRGGGLTVVVLALLGGHDFLVLGVAARLRGEGARVLARVVVDVFGGGGGGPAVDAGLVLFITPAASTTVALHFFFALFRFFSDQ